MRRSLRLRLAAAVVGALASALLVLSLVLHAIFGRALWRQFDGGLRDDAAAVAGMAEDDGARGEFEAESLPEFERRARPAYYEAWLDDGSVLARSPSLGSGDLPRAPGAVAAATFAGLALPDGRAGRAVQLRQPLRVEAEEAPTPAGRVSTRFVTVVIARGTEDVDDTLASVRRWLLWLGLAGLLATSAVALAAISHGLRPLRALAAELGGLDAARLDRVLSVDGLPEELAPLVAKLNELLARLRESFAREKRFTADVSHELRTPLAGLRATLEVAGSRDRTAAEYRSAIDDAGVVVLQMQALCENLLALARLDAGVLPVRREAIALHALVQGCWRPFQAAARERDLTFENELPPTAVVESDPDQLRLVVGNLLSNAAAYTARGGSIRVRAGAAAGVVLEVHDSGPRIPDETLAHVFERFFRGDPTRSDGLHCGIGLALARGVSQALGLSLTARNTADGGVTFAVGRP